MVPQIKELAATGNFGPRYLTVVIIVLVLDGFRILEIIIVTLILIQLLWFLC